VATGTRNWGFAQEPGGSAKAMGQGGSGKRPIGAIVQSWSMAGSAISEPDKALSVVAVPSVRREEERALIRYHAR